MYQEGWTKLYSEKWSGLLFFLFLDMASTLDYTCLKLTQKEGLVMRKVICVLLCAIFLTTPVLASDVDLSGYSVEELLELQQNVSDALFENNGLQVIQPGTYVVGRDIAAGNYILKPHTEDGSFKYFVYKSEKARRAYENACNKYLVEYSKAADREDAGEEPNWPKSVSETKYMSQQGYADEEDKSGVGVTLTDNELLVISSGYGEITITIEKSGGLFMD